MTQQRTESIDRAIARMSDVMDDEKLTPDEMASAAFTLTVRLCRALVMLSQQPAQTAQSLQKGLYQILLEIEPTDQKKAS